MFERFTDRARRVVVLAQEEARLLNHNYIGTEHILLGLIHEGEGVAAKALESLGISLEAVREQVEEIIGQGGSSPSGHIPFTPRAKKVLELSLREALQLGHNYIGTEHILLGLIREGEGVAAQVLTKLGADLSRVRQQVIQLLSGYSGSGEQEGEGGRKGERASAGTGGRGGDSSSSMVLDQFGRNLTQLAKEGKVDPVIGRSREAERVMQVLSRRTKNNPVLVGEPARPAIARRRGQRRRPPVGDPRQRRTGRREVRRAGAGDDDGHRAGLKRGAAHLPAATRAAGGTACHVAPRRERGRTFDHTRPGTGSGPARRADRGNRAAREDALYHVFALQLGFLARGDTRSSERTADTLVGVAAAAGPRFCDELPTQLAIKQRQCPRGPLERARATAPRTTAL